MSDKDSKSKQANYRAIIIGAGPGGLQLAYYLQKRREPYLVLEEAEEVGAFFRTFPRHRRLISINKVHTGFDDTEVNLRWDWNSLLSADDAMLFKEFSRKYFPDADDMVQYLRTFASHYDLNIRTSSRVTRVSRGERFEVVLDDGTNLSSDLLIVATGRAKPYIPPIPGIEMAENYNDVSIDPEDFANQRVFIIGKGNSAFETADNLVGTTSVLHLASPRNVAFAWKTHYVGHLRAVNNNILDTYQLKSQNTIIDGEIENISRSNGKYTVTVHYTHAENQRIDVPVDRVILAAGFVFDDDIFDESARPHLTSDGKFPDMTSEWESVNVEGMYFAGALMHARDYRKTFSGFIHGFRYNVEVLDRFLSCKYNGGELPSEVIDRSAGALLTVLYHRIHTNSSLFQQPGFLCDLIDLGPDDGQSTCRYYEDLPVDYVHDKGLLDGRKCVMLTMEYGKQDHPDPFNIDRKPRSGDESAFIHPVLRYFENQDEQSVYHIPEDLENNWYQELYLGPFYEYLLGLVGEAGEFDLHNLELPFEFLKETTVCR